MLALVCSIRPDPDLLAVDRERGDAALAAAVAVVGEVHRDGRLAGREPLGAVDGVLLQPDEVIGVGGPAVLHVQAPAAEAAALGENHAVGGAGGNLDVRGDRHRLVLDVDEGVLHHPGHALVDGQRLAPGHQVRPSRRGGVEALDRAVVNRQHAVALGFLHEQRLQFLELGGVRGGEVGGLAEVLVDVVELPHVLGELVARLRLPRRLVHGGGDPAVAVDGAVAEHLEVLRLVPVRRLGIVEGVDHADAFHRRLRDAVDRLRLRDVRGFEHGRRDVDDVLELTAHLAPGLDAIRPADHQRIAGAAEVGGHLLGPHERRVAGHRPARRHVREGLGAAPLVDVLQHLGHRLGDAVEVGHLVEHPDHAAFGAGAVVADLIDDQRVVELAHVLDRLHHPADLVVGVGGKRGEHFHLAREQPLFVGGQRSPTP